MNVKLSTDTITAASAKNYTILKDFSFNNAGATASYKAGDTVKVDVRNSLRAVVDVSSGVSTTSADYTALGTGAHKAFVDDAASYTRINKVAGYKADSVGSIGESSTNMVNFGTSMANETCPFLHMHFLDGEIPDTQLKKDSGVFQSASLKLIQ